MQLYTQSAGETRKKHDEVSAAGEEKIDRIARKKNEHKHKLKSRAGNMIDFFALTA